MLEVGLESIKGIPEYDLVCEMVSTAYLTGYADGVIGFDGIVGNKVRKGLLKAKKGYTGRISKYKKGGNK